MKRPFALFVILLFISTLTAQVRGEMVTVFGTEYIYTKINRYQNIENSILPYVSRILSEVYRLKPVTLNGLESFLQDNYLNEQAAAAFIKKTNPAIRYAVFYSAKTNIITDFGYANIPPAVEAEITLSVYDLAANEVYHTSGNTGATFSPDTLSEQNIIHASKNALRFLTNEKNSENCSVLLHSIFVNF